MRSFKDNQDREWNLNVYAGSAAEVRNIHGVDLTKLHEGEIKKLDDDLILLVAVVYTLCKSQADLAKVDEVQFGEALVGDALSNALDALWLAVSDFFPARSGKRAAMSKILQAATILESRGNKAISEVDPETLANMIQNQSITSNGATN